MIFFNKIIGLTMRVEADVLNQVISGAIYLSLLQNLYMYLISIV